MKQHLSLSTQPAVPLLSALLIAALALSTGCSRGQYRTRADIDAYAAIAEKAAMLPTATGPYSIDIDPRSRIFDPFNPDFPPMPPDDPTSDVLMHMTGGKHPKRGYAHWGRNGFTSYTENPDWCAFLNVQETDDGAQMIIVDSRYAMQLALMNSRDYQTELEDLYLSALDVSSERFRFQTMFFGGYRAEYTADGPDRPGGGGNSRSVLNLSTFAAPGSTSWQMNRFFTTGADLAVGLANSLVWQFSGPDDYMGTTLIDFALVQPLLRQAGRDRIMETLTLSERTLLANVRQMERYRRGFYLEVITGRNAGPGPQRRGGQFGAGLAGFTGVGTVGFAGAGGGGQGGAGAGGGTGAQGAGGLIGLLQQQQEIRNAEDNVEGLRRVYLEQLELLQEERVSQFDPAQSLQVKSQLITSELQVAQARQAVLDAESSLVNNKNQYQQTLDSFKTTLGLPPQLCLEVQDPTLDEFTTLVDQATQRYLRGIDEIRRAVGNAGRTLLSRVVEIKDEQERVIGREIRSVRDVEQELRGLKPQTDRIAPILDEIIGEKLPQARGDIERLKQAVPRRIEELRRMKLLYDSELAGGGEQDDDQFMRPCEHLLCPHGCRLLPISDIDPAIFDVVRLEALPGELEQRLDQLTARFQTYEERLAQIHANMEQIIAENTQLEADNNGMNPQGAQLRRDVLQIAIDVQGVLIELNDDVRGLQLLMATARAESIELPKVELTPQQALEIARLNRRDWMNARASLVDAWRLIQFNADALQSQLDVVFSGDIRNVGQNPVNLQGTTGRLRVALEFDAPLTRLIERNTYRQSLIEYQRARRSFMEFEDTVSVTLRATLRTLEANRLNFENRRFALFNSIRQIELNEQAAEQQILIQSSTGSAGGGRNTATRDAVQAQNDLLTAKNNLLSFWVNYEVLRRGLDFDLGTMQLDPEGIWIDPGPLGPEFVAAMTARDSHCYSDAELLAPGPAVDEYLDGAPPVPPQSDQQGDEELPPPGVDLPPPPAQEIQRRDRRERPTDPLAVQDVDINLTAPRKANAIQKYFPGSANPNPRDDTSGIGPLEKVPADKGPSITLELTPSSEEPFLPLLPPGGIETAQQPSNDAPIRR